MTTPKNSNIKDGNNNNQEDNMRELKVTQTQLNQVTAQFLANTSEVDPTMQRFLETQTQLLYKVTDQMINMGYNSSQGDYGKQDVNDDILEGTQACNICGDKDHTSKEHDDQCPNCEEKHPTNQCPTSQATCYLCEGNNHVPIQCPIYYIVQQRKQGGVHQQIANPYEGTTSTKKDEYKGKSQLAPPYNMTQLDGQKRKDMYYPRKRLRRPGDFPTFEVRYEEHELEELLALEKPKKKKNKEISQVWCNNCKELGHYISTCLEKIREELNLVTCYKCGDQGHYASNCPERMKYKTSKHMKDLSLVTCFKCGNKGHYADVCPEKFHQDPKQAKM